MSDHKNHMTQVILIITFLFEFSYLECGRIFTEERYPKKF